MTEVKTLAQSMSEMMDGSFTDTAAYKLRDVKVVSEHWSHEQRWPGPQKNVHFWVKLENGKIVGFNENPGRGWSFPVGKIKL